jgi:hypothetical protein
MDTDNTAHSSALEFLGEHNDSNGSIFSLCEVITLGRLPPPYYKKNRRFDPHRWFGNANLASHATL